MWPWAKHLAKTLVHRLESTEGSVLEETSNSFLCVFQQGETRHARDVGPGLSWLDIDIPQVIRNEPYAVRSYLLDNKYLADIPLSDS